MDNAIVTTNYEDYAMQTSDVQRQVNMIQDVMRSVMQDGEHYGVIPGTNKPSLLKPGAEKLSLVFRLRPEYQVTRTDMPGGHREYEITCSLYHIPTGAMIGQGVGSATTMENKYRFRTGPTELTDSLVPKEYWDTRKDNPAKAQEIIGGKGFTTKKNDAGKWVIAIQGEKVEHENPADYYNTVLKMAKKRAHVDAILTATAASDIFTQDTEDLAENGALKGQPAESKQDKKKANPPQQESKGDEKEGETVTIGVGGVTVKEGKNQKGEKYSIFTVTDPDGNSYKTFKKEIAAKAKEARDNGVNVKITFKKGQYGNDIISLEHDIPEFDEAQEANG